MKVSFLSYSAMLIAAMSAISSARADQAPNDGAYLDPPYASIEKARVNDALNDLSVVDREKFLDGDAARSTSLFDFQSPVKSQGSRGTCSIFSATAMLES